MTRIHGPRLHPNARVHVSDAEGEVADGLFIERRVLLSLPLAALGASACRPRAPAESVPRVNLPAAASADSRSTELSRLAFSAFVARWRALTARLVTDGDSIDAYLYALAALAARIDALPPTTMKASSTMGPGIAFGEVHREAPIVATQWRLQAGASIPPHNHPPFCGVTLGLEGSCRIRTYRLRPPQASPRDPERTTRVERIGDERCAPGRVVSLVSPAHNVHEFLPARDGARGVDLYATIGDRSDFSGLTISDAPLGDEDEVFAAQWP